MSDKDMLQMAGMFARMFFFVVLGMSLVGLVTHKLRSVKDRVRCNVAIIFGTPVVLIALGFLLQWLGLWIVGGFLPLLIIGLFFGGVSVLFTQPHWIEKQIGLSFMLASVAIYAFLIVAYQGGS
jgi:hypothetical protein